ncbi:hypothetical protein [Paenibacillus sp. B-A-8]|uniref:hypothetical protein n=1 Tax=Paenibacillus sp. B-A-8 TaxID=3400419 RepID=UPI003B0185D3
MELLYFWVDSYGYFQTTEFHFQNTYQFKYDPAFSRLQIKKKGDGTLPEHFFGNNITNLSMIVGDNGSGKTTLLRMIMDCLTNEYNSTPFITAFFDQVKKKVLIYRSELHLELEAHNDIPVAFLTKNALKDWLKKTKLVYISNVLDIHDYMYNKSGMLHDLSIGGLMRRDHSSGVENHHIHHEFNPIHHFFNNEVYRQLDFLYHYNLQESNTKDLFGMVNKLQINVVDNERNRKLLYESIQKQTKRHHSGSSSRRDFNTLPNNDYWKVLGLVSASFSSTHPNEIWKFRFADHLFVNAIKETVESVTTSDKRLEELECLLNVYRTYDKSTFKDVFMYTMGFLEQVRMKLNSIHSIYTNRLDPYISFLSWLTKNSTQVEESVDNVSAALIGINLKNNTEDWFKEFFTHYNRTCRPYYYLNFSWGLSTGENNLLSLYSRFHSVLEAAPNGGRSNKVINHTPLGDVACTGVLLLIDEADLSYHLKWQVQYINRLLQMLDNFFKSCKVQVILTSHSPMLLSDIPKSNVIYLKDGNNDPVGNHMETFGQNIHTLFNDAFFVHQTVGEFSNQIIQNAGEDLNKLEQSIIRDKGNPDQKTVEPVNLEKYEFIASIIGEPVIKKAFENKLQGLKDHYQTEALKSAISLYDNLSQEDRERLIDHIIKANQRDDNQ